MTPKYRKKPIVIEAQQFRGGVEDATLLMDWVRDSGGKVTYRKSVTEIRVKGGELARKADPEHLYILTLEGPLRANVGDYIIKGIQGEFYPCKSGIFAATYEDA